MTLIGKSSVGRWFPSEWARLTKPDAGYPADRELVAKHLKVGACYPVQAEDIGASSGRVLLMLDDGAACCWFNTVHFVDAQSSLRSWNDLGFWQYACGCVQYQDGWERCSSHQHSLPNEPMQADKVEAEAVNLPTFRRGMKLA